MAEGMQTIRQTGPDGAPVMRISLALFLAGFATFSLLYCTQPLLPEFSADFNIDPATSSLSLSLTTSFLAIAIMFAGALSESLGRRALMFASMFSAAILNLLAAYAPTWELLLVVRALEGVALGGVPAVAMAYLAEEMPPWRLGAVMGLYVAGTAFGGMIGRFSVGVLTDHFSWRVALMGISAADLVCSVLFFLMLPPSRNFIRRKSLGAAYHFQAWKAHILAPSMPLLFAVGFLCMGTFVTVFNYIGFRLTQAPLDLSQSQVGMIFLSYIFGMFASSTAGGLADRIGRSPVMIGGCLVTFMGLALTMLSSIPFIVAGVVGVVIGFFTVHAVASAWVGRLAQGNKSHAASLYLLAYYLGSSVIGSSGGWFWHEGGWQALVAYCGVLSTVMLIIIVILRRRETGHG